MVRAAALLVVPTALVALAAPATAAPGTPVTATVDESGPKGQVISLTQGGKGAGAIELTRCTEGSATSFFCSGTGTVDGLGPAKVRFRWRCPVGKSCQDHAEGTLKNRGVTLALLHVAAGVPKVQHEGATFTIKVEPIPE